MASPALGFYDGEFNKNDTIAHGLSRDIAGIYEKPLHLMLDAIFYDPHPASDSDSPPQETSGYVSTFWPNGAQEHDFTNRQALGSDEEGQPHYNGGSSWLSEYGSSICGGWGEDFLYCGLEKAEDSYNGGEEYDSYYKEKEKQQPAAYDDYSAWSGCGAEEDLYVCSGKNRNSRMAFGMNSEFIKGSSVTGLACSRKNMVNRKLTTMRTHGRELLISHIENSVRW